MFGEVPRFTENRLVKYYKGLLGTWFGDLGPFYVGLALAAVWWWIRRLFGRIRPLRLTLDDRHLPARRWVAVIVLNGDLGKDFKLGRGLDLGSGTFRVITIADHGLRAMLLARSGRVARPSCSTIRRRCRPTCGRCARCGPSRSFRARRR